MKISEMKTADEVLAEDLKDPEFRREWERERREAAEQEASKGDERRGNECYR